MSEQNLYSAFAPMLDVCQKQENWVELSRLYYQMGVAAMNIGELNHAVLWLHRADTIYSARDEIFDGVGKQLRDDCSSRIGTLEDAPLLYNHIPSKIDNELAEAVGDAQVRVWGLLSMARLVPLGKRLAALPGCELLEELEWCVDMMLRSFQELPPQADYQRLFALCSRFYEFNGGPHFWCGEIEVPGGKPFQVFDLNGMFGVTEEISTYIDSHLRLLSALSQGREDPGAESGVVGVTLLPDYYVRTTGTEKPEEIPQVKAELERMMDDYDFIRSGVTWDEVRQRVEAYKRLDILAV